MTYPTDWPKCVLCQTAPRLDGHLTCGQASCSESDARERRAHAWAAEQARKHNAECELEIERLHGRPRP